MDKKTILRKIEEVYPVLSSRYSVEKLELFGSYAKETAKRNSDIDLLVSFVETPDLLTFIEMEEYLSALLGKRVDLVIKRKVKPGLKKSIMEDAIAI